MNRYQIEMENALRQGGADIQPGTIGQFSATMRKFQFLFSFSPVDGGDPEDCPVRIGYAGFSGGRTFPDLMHRSEVRYLRLCAYLNELNRDSGPVKYLYDGETVRAEICFDYRSLNYAFSMLMLILKEVKKTRPELRELLNGLD